MDNYIFKYGGSYFGKNKNGSYTPTKEEIMMYGSDIIDYTDKQSFVEVNARANKVFACANMAEEYRADLRFEDASREYEKVAIELDNLKDKLALKYYAYAAIMNERSEKWRSISALWYKASGNGEAPKSSTNHPNEYTKTYTDFNTLEHIYPTISFEKWDSLSKEMKKAKAIQYAAYSEDNYGGPPDSYWLYEEAVLAYKEANDTDKMIECLVSATNRYVNQYNRVPDTLMPQWKEVLKCKKLTLSQKKMIVSAFDEIYKNMYRNGCENAKFFYVESKKMRIRVLAKQKKYLRALKGVFDRFTSGFGTNGILIIVHVLIFVLMLFPVLYLVTGSEGTIIKAIGHSLNVFLGIKYDSDYSRVSYWIGMAELLYSYFTLVVVGTYLVNKVVKQLN